MTLLLHLATLKVDKIHMIRHDDQITKRLFRLRMEHVFDATCSRVARMTSQPHESTVFYNASWPSGSPHPIFYNIFPRPQNGLQGGLVALLDAFIRQPLACHVDVCQWGSTWPPPGLPQAFRKVNLAAQAALPSDRLHWISAVTNSISIDSCIH